MLATCSPVDDLVNDRSGIKSCPAAETRASAREVGDADALLAARLAAGDHVALTEAFDRLAPAVYHGLALAKLETVLDRQLLEQS